MAEISTLNGYKLKDKKAIRYYNTVADMVADTTLKNGMYAKTKGYYLVNDGGGSEYHITNAESLLNYQESLNNSLYADLILKNSYINVNQYGMKPNDPSFDNSELFNSLIEMCNNKGLNIEFNSGVYYFETPINIDYRLKAITIKGQGVPYTDVNPYNNGTTLRYTGENWFITLTGNCWKCNIKDLQIESNDNGLKISGVFFQSHLENVHFLNCKNAILLKQFAYAHFNNIQINTDNANSEYALQIGEETTDVTEYLFVDGFINEDDNIHSGNNGIVIKKGIHLDFKNMDFVKKYNAVKIEPIELIRYIFFDNVDIARCHIGFNINILLAFSNLKISNSMCAFREEADSTDRFIIVDKANGQLITNFITENIGGVALNPSVKPDYMVEFLKSNMILKSSISIDYNPSNLSNKLYLSDSEENILSNYYQKLSKTSRVFNNSGTKTVTITLLTNSPYNVTPWVNIQSNKPVIKSYVINNTNGGNLTATITLVDDFTTGNFVLFSDIPTGEYQQQALNS